MKKLNYNILEIIKMGVLNNYFKYSNMNINEHIKNVTQQIISSGGLKLDKNNNYDIPQKRLANVGEGIDQQDAIL